MFYELIQFVISEVYRYFQINHIAANLDNWTKFHYKFTFFNSSEWWMFKTYTLIK